MSSEMTIMFHEICVAPTKQNVADRHTDNMIPLVTCCYASTPFVQLYLSYTWPHLSSAYIACSFISPYVLLYMPHMALPEQCIYSLWLCLVLSAVLCVTHGLT